MPKDKTTFIKLDRSILEWPYFSAPKTAHMYLYLLLKANIRDKFFMGVKIPRGSLAASRETISRETGLSVQDQRTAVKHMVANGDIHVTRHSRFMVYEIVNYDYWQENKKVKEKKTTSGSKRGTVYSQNSSYDLKGYIDSDLFDDE